MAIKRGLIRPKLFDVNEARIKNILGITILKASCFSAAGLNHAPHDWPCAGEVFRGQPDSANNQ